MSGKARASKAKEKSLEGEAGTRAPDDEPSRADHEYAAWQERIQTMPPDEVDALFERVRQGSASRDDHLMFDALWMWRFVARTECSGKLEPWIHNAMMNRLINVLEGGDWRREFPLPWEKPIPIRSVAEQRALDIYVFVEKMRLDARLRTGKKMAVTEAFERLAYQMPHSFETVRADYYKAKKLFKFQRQKLE